MSSQLLPIALLSTTPQSSISSSSSRIQQTLAQRTHIPAHVYKHPAAILLELCTSMEELHQIIPLIIKNGLYEEHLFQTKLVSLFCRYGSLTEATRVFEPIENKNDALYHTMIKGYAQNSSIFDGLSFFSRMMEDGVQPVVYNFTYLLKGCGENHLVRNGKEVHAQLILNGHEDDVYAMTCVVNMYAKCRLIHDAHKVFAILPLYNHTLATILVEYASAVYMSDLTELFTWTCSRCDGLTKGFEVIELIVDVENCLQAFVGVADEPNAIVIAFRGTQETSIQNWIEDLFWKQLDFDYPGCTDGKVHHGFFNAYNNTIVRSGILDGVSRAKEAYGDLKIMVTGHSMGGAMAAFCGLDLALIYGSENVEVMTFGQPRIGNANFASYFSEVVPNTFRVTHEHDLVPHLPPYYQHFPQKTYHHFPREVWIYNIGFGFLIYEVEKVCDGSGEDPDCSRSVSGNSISDHLSYMGVEMGCDTSSKCRIVMGPGLASYGKVDDNGNFALSRVPSKFMLKMKTEPKMSDQ